jgi:hypothetical protein
MLTGGGGGGASLTSVAGSVTGHLATTDRPGRPEQGLLVVGFLFLVGERHPVEPVDVALEHPDLPADGDVGVLEDGLVGVADGRPGLAVAERGDRGRQVRLGRAPGVASCWEPVSTSLANRVSST